MWSVAIEVHTSAREEILIVTDQIAAALRGVPASEGLLHLFIPHTTCAITINENADPAVLTDLIKAYRAVIPTVRFEHAEGNSDAHFLSSLIGVSLIVPYAGGRMALGRWQGIYFVELDGPRKRKLEIRLVS